MQIDSSINRIDTNPSHVRSHPEHSTCLSMCINIGNSGPGITWYHIMTLPTLLTPYELV